MNQSITFNDVWQHLIQEQWIDEAPVPEVTKDEESAVPWYVAGLIGISGWVAAGFLIGFLALAELLSGPETTLIIGIVFCIAALVITYAARRAIFPNQLAFALSLAGQALIIGSRLDNFETEEIVATVLVLETILFIVYPDALHRLISFAAIITATAIQLGNWSWNEGFPLLALLLAVGAFLVWWQQIPIQLSRFRCFFPPLAIGLPLGGLGLCITQLIDFEYFEARWWLAAFGIALLLLLLAGLVLRELSLQPLSIAGVGVLGIVAIVMIPAFNTPGIIMALLVLAIAYWRNSTLLLGIGILGLLAFLSAYYYNLELDLLTKSLLLMGSGLGTLCVRFVLGWLTQREEVIS